MVSGKQHLKIKEENGALTSNIFVCPYGYVVEPVSAINNALMEECCIQHGICLLEVDTSVVTGRLLCQYRNLNPLLAFILNEVRVELKRKLFIFYEVLIPESSGPLSTLMPGVS